MSNRVYGYRRGLHVPEALHSRLGFNRVYEGWCGSVRSTDYMLNWGSSTFRWTHDDCRVINTAAAVSNCVNKLRSMQILADAYVPTPDYTTNRATAERWVSDGETVYCRTRLTGARGQGIVLATDLDGMVDAQLYTKGVMKAREYRLFVFKDNVYHITQKRRRASNPDASSEIKNHRTGWVFAFNNITAPPDEAQQVAVDAVRALGLDFGAVDLITKRGVCRVLEVNSAPGMQGTSLTKFIGQVSNWIGG